MLIFQTPSRGPNIGQTMLQLLPGLAIGVWLVVGLRSLGVGLPVRLAVSQGAMYFAWSFMAPSANRATPRSIFARRLSYAAFIGVVGGTVIYLVSVAA